MQTVGDGVTRSKATAVWSSMRPYDGQQIGVDLSLIPNMAAAVGAVVSRAAAQVVS